MKRSVWLVLAGLLFLTVIELLKVFFIMPFPGSQESNSIGFAYFLHNNIWWMRTLAWVLIAYPLFNLLTKGRGVQRSVWILALLLYFFIVYLFNFKMMADKMFYQPKEKTFVPAEKDTTNKDKLVIGIVFNNHPKAYPIEIIGYHHQIADSIEENPILVTYCTVCRTGRVYSPMVNGKPEKFRLVGMDHFNAMFEDESTKSWWQQATGEAIMGQLKGTQLPEIPSAQMRLGEWLALYPNSEVLQPDSHFKKEYTDLKGFDEGTIKGKLEHRDSLSWKNKSWVVGIVANGKSKAYDWNELIKQKMITDTLSDEPLLLTVEPNGKTFYAFNRTLEGQSLQFIQSSTANVLEDTQTHSTWQANGTCTAGEFQGKRLKRMQAYQEFWHSWKNFHPTTTIFKP